MSIPITVTGNLTADPQLSHTPSGVCVVSFTVAVNERVKNGAGEWTDGPTSFVRCYCWRDLADHVAESLTKGDRAMVHGFLRERTYTTEPKHQGDTGKRTVWEVQAQAVGAELRYATAAVKRVRRDGVPLPDEPWRDVPAPDDHGYSDEPPF
jgi:single-strand DNA-binding protein